MGSKQPWQYYCQCGTRLAKDNSGPQCARCERRSRDKLIAPPEVLPEFWDTEQFREALAAQHMGWVARAYRTHPSHHPVYGPSGISQTLLGQWVGLQQPHVSRFENGPPTQHLDTLRHWARVLRIPPELLWFDMPGERRQGLKVPDGFVDQTDADDGNVEGLASLLNDLTADHLPILGTRGAKGVRVSALEGSSVTDRVQVLLKLFLQLDDELGGDVLYLPLSRYVARLGANIEQDSTDGLAAFAQLSQMTGWLALDGNRHGAARRYFTSAIYAAHEAQQLALAASSLAYLSLQETYRGRLSSALSLAQTAFSVGNGSLTPLTKTMVTTRLARAHAGVHNTDECLRSLDGMRTAFSCAGQQEEPLWISYVDEVEVAAQEGACYLDLGMANQASVALTTALELLSRMAPHRTRDQVHYLVRLARCSLLQHEVERACEVATEAVALSEAIGSARVIERLSELSAALDPFSTCKAVREFRQLYAAIIVQRAAMN
ncbi:MAG: DNA-binding protein [Acidobacteria bacterium]|nr:DNA-binding protein [Acidobacteriota bacterium]